MKKIRSILLLQSFSETITESDLASQQRFRLFKIFTLFALFIFAMGIYQVSIAEIHNLFFIVLIYALFVTIFINYFGLGIHKKPGTAYLILMALAFAVLHIISYGQGGIRNSGIFYLGAIILGAYMLLGKTAGKVMAGISIIHVIYFYFITVYTNWTNYSFLGTDPRMIDIDFLITGTLSVLILTAQANYVEESKNAITEDIKTKRDQLATKNTELLITQKNLKVKNKEFEQKNKELEQFAYVASHDLQEPLRTTSSYVGLLQQQYKGNLDEKADKYLSYISQASGRMQVLVSDLLEYSRIGSKKDLKLVDCNEVLNETLADLDVAINETSAGITAGDLPVISGYPTEIKQLFQNLISNSIKFRRKDIPPVITICSWDHKDYSQFAFSDNGIGIANHHHERIFTIFQRLHIREKYLGSGIGLSHCKKIVELHRGKIWLESTPGEGTTFYLTIPKNSN